MTTASQTRLNSLLQQALQIETRVKTVAEGKEIPSGENVDMFVFNVQQDIEELHEQLQVW